MKPRLYGMVLLGVFTSFNEEASADYIFTAIGPPGSRTVVASGINDSGQIVGYYDGHGFLLSGGNYARLDVPGSFPDSTGASGINNAGQIVGSYSDASSRQQDHAFLVSGGRYATIDPPGSTQASAYGINNAGQIVGGYNAFGFLRTGGNYTTISVPGSNYVTATGINDHGQIVGSYDTKTTLGFLLSRGNYTTIQVPGSSRTFASDINNPGQIVGSYDVGLIRHGFIWSDGVYTTIDFPGSTFTFVSGINDAGQIVGGYDDSQGVPHGFVASPVPEPATLILIAIGALCVLGRAAIEPAAHCLQVTFRQRRPVSVHGRRVAPDGVLPALPFMASGCTD